MLVGPGSGQMLRRMWEMRMIVKRVLVLVLTRGRLEIRFSRLMIDDLFYFSCFYTTFSNLVLDFTFAFLVLNSGFCWLPSIFGDWLVIPNWYFVGMEPKYSF